MDYEKAYKHALDLAKQVHDTTISKQQKENIEIIFPELRESEDERIRKELLESFKYQQRESRTDKEWLNGIKLSEVVAWLEKQGEQPQGKTALEAIKEEKVDNQNRLKPADKVEPFDKFAGLTDFERTLADICIGWIGEEPGWKEYIKDNADVLLKIAIEKFNSVQDASFEQKPVDKIEPMFKVGDWVVDNCGYVWKIEGILNQFYILEGVEGGESRPTIEWVNKTFHLWTIQDAKDGDVLIASDDSVFIYAGSTDRHAQFYIALSKYGDFNTEGGNWEDKNCVKPATKEQRDTLMKAMADAGWKFDFEKKELKKIHVIDEGKAEMDYCFTKMMNGEKVSSTWSEEDEYMLNETIQHLEELIRIDKAKHLACDVQYYQRDIDWLKLLKERVQPQNTWKPSKEQMRALHDMNLTGNISYAGQGQTLIELYNDLKKL